MKPWVHENLKDQLIDVEAKLKKVTKELASANEMSKLREHLNRQLHDEVKKLRKRMN